MSKQHNIHNTVLGANVGVLLQLARAVLGARSVNATVAVVTVRRCVMKPPAVKRVLRASKEVTVTKISMSV